MPGSRDAWGRRGACAAVLVGVLLGSLVVAASPASAQPTSAGIALTQPASGEVLEGDHFSTGNSFSFTVTLDQSPSGSDVTVAWQIVPGGAEHPADADDVLAGNDAGTLVFEDGGAASHVLTVQLRGDTAVEPDETLTVEISSDDVAPDPEAARASGSILTDEPIVTVAPVQEDPDAPAEVTEGTTLVFEVSLTAGGDPVQPAVPVTIPFAITGDDASEHSVDVEDPSADVVAVDETGTELEAYELTIPETATSGLIRLQAIDDGIGEPRREGFTLTLAPDLGDVEDAILVSSPDPLVLTGAVVDVQPHVSIETDVDVLEADGSDVTGAIVVSIDRPPGAEVQVPFASTSDPNDPSMGAATPATANQDYEAVSGTLTFPEGDASPRAIDVTVAGDTEAEGAEFFAVVLADAPAGAGYWIDEPVGFVRIVDNEIPTVSIADVEAEEGGPGQARSLDFVVQVAPASGTAIGLTYSTADGSAKIADSDYVKPGNNTPLSVPAGVRSVTVPITMTGDDKHEGDEGLTLTVNTSGSGYKVQKADRSVVNPGTAITAGGTIVNDDPVPTILMDDFAGREGDFDRPFELGVHLSNPSDRCTTVRFFTRDGTAVAPGDYTAVISGSLAFKPGDVQPNQGSVAITASSQTGGSCRGNNAYVAVRGDTTTVPPEPNEAFEVVLLGVCTFTNSSGVLVAMTNGCDLQLPNRAPTHSATFTILNDDGPHLKIDDPRVVESDSEVVFTVEVADFGADPVTVDYATEDGTGIAGSDYTAATGTLTIPGDTASATVTVPIADDALAKPDRTFSLRLSHAAGATIFDGLGTALIEDDDDPSRPIADAGPPATAMEGEEAGFDGSGSVDQNADGEITLYVWDFGDGSFPVSSAAPTVAHTFDRAGTYTVTLTVTDDELKTDTDVTTATITNAPPQIELTGDTSVEAQTPASFFVSGTSSVGGPFLIDWDFGDGDENSENVTGVTHAFSAAGTYTVTVTVADGDGGEASDTWEISVTPDVGDVNRAWGDDRMWTAIWVSRLFWPDGGGTTTPSAREPAGETTTSGAPHAVIATSRDFPDALAGGALAALLDAPILLNPRDRLDPDVAGELERRGVRTVWLLGGGAALSKNVSDELAFRGYDVLRFNGSDRFDTAAQIAQAAGATADGEVVIALGQHADPSRDAWPDALSAGALAAVPDPLPVLLTRSDALPEATAGALRELGATRAYVVGGPVAISAGVVDQLAELGLDVVRLAGEDRYATSVAVASEAVRRHPTQGLLPAVFARGTAFPDGLPAGALAARLGALLVLVPTDDLGRAERVEVFLGEHAHRIDEGVVVGGTVAVSDRVITQLVEAIRAR